MNKIRFFLIRRGFLNLNPKYLEISVLENENQTKWIADNGDYKSRLKLIDLIAKSPSRFGLNILKSFLSDPVISVSEKAIKAIYSISEEGQFSITDKELEKILIIQNANKAKLLQEKKSFERLFESSKGTFEFYEREQERFEWHGRNNDSSYGF